MLGLAISSFVLIFQLICKSYCISLYGFDNHFIIIFLAHRRCCDKESVARFPSPAASDCDFPITDMCRLLKVSLCVEKEIPLSVGIEVGSPAH